MGPKSSGWRIAPLLVAVGLLVLVGALPVRAGHAKTDIVTTDDGGTYIGEIDSVQYATVTLDTNPAGTISIEWRHVTGLTSSFSYRIELDGGIQHYGSLGTPTKPGHLKIVTTEGSLEVGLNGIVSILPYQHEFWKSLDGSINFGLTYTQANEAFQYNLNANVDRRTRKHYANLTAQSTFNVQQDNDSTPSTT